MLEVEEDRVGDTLRALGVLEIRAGDVDSWFITVYCHILEWRETLVVFQNIPRVTHKTVSELRSLAVQLGVQRYTGVGYSEVIAIHALLTLSRRGVDITEVNVDYLTIGHLGKKVAVA